MACVPGAVIQYAALAARRPRPDRVREAAPARPALAAAARTVGAAGRRFPRRRPPGRAGRRAAAPRPPRARGQLQLPLRARAHGAGAQARLARHGLELPLLLRRAEPPAALVPLGRDRRPGGGGAKGARGIGLGSAPARRVLAGRKRGGEVAGRAGRVGAGARGRHAPGTMSFVYRSRFLRTLKHKALAKARKFPGIAEARVRSARTLFEFDEALTGPVHGFAGAEDYWARSSSGPFVARVRVPLLLLSAEDDPFIPASCLPREAAAANPCVTLETHPRGGHLGFVAGPYVPWFWAEWRVAECLAEHL